MSTLSEASSLRAAAWGTGLLLAALATITTADSDLWGHLRFGLDTLETSSLPYDDPYSFTQDRPWINHEWLSELAMAIAWTLGRAPGLALLKGVLVSSALLLAWRALREADLGARIVVLAAVAAATAPIARTLRPQLWTLLFLVLLCRVLAEGWGRARYALPLLFAFWANLHGGWIVGLGVLGAWTGAEILQSRRVDWAMAGVVIASLLATLATPYAWELWVFLGTTVRMGRDITEWQPLWNSPPIDAVPWLVVVTASLWLLRSPTTNRLPKIAVLLVLAYSSARVVRIAPLFVACAGVLLADSIRARWPQRAGKPLVDPSPSNAVAAAVIGAATVIGAVWVGSWSLGCIRTESPRAADGPAAALLKTAQPGRLITFFDWGQYALWHLGPKLRVSMDGRRETVYSDERLAEHAAILSGWPEGLSLLDEWRPEYVWLPSTSARTRDWLASRGYRIEFSSEASFVAVREDLPPLQPGPPKDPRAFACFPG